MQQAITYKTLHKKNNSTAKKLIGGGGDATVSYMSCVTKWLHHRDQHSPRLSERKDGSSSIERRGGTAHSE